MSKNHHRANHRQEYSTQPKMVEGVYGGLRVRGREAENKTRGWGLRKSKGTSDITHQGTSQHEEPLSLFNIQIYSIFSVLSLFLEPCSMTLPPKSTLHHRLSCPSRTQPKPSYQHFMFPPAISTLCPYLCRDTLRTLTHRIQCLQVP